MARNVSGHFWDILVRLVKCNSMIEQLEKRLTGIQSVMMAHHEATSKLPSAAMGDEREVLVREFLEKVFPFPYRFGTGAITDSSGKVSGQLDVVVEWPFFASFPAPVGTQRLYLAESVAYAIEVKSNVAKKWDDIQQTVSQIRQLRRRWTGHLATQSDATNTKTAFAALPGTISTVPIVVVGFEGYASAQTLSSKLNEIPPNNRPDAVLVIKSGVYVTSWQTRQFSGSEGLLAFCADGSYFVRNVLAADPDLSAYY